MDKQIVDMFREYLSTEVSPDELDAHKDRVIVRIAASPHRELTATVIAGYLALRDQNVPRDKALACVSKAFHEPTQPYIYASTKTALDAATDPFSLIVEVSKDREENYFGPDFEFKRAVDNDDQYRVDVHRCFYVNALSKAGTPELGPVFCDFDASWIGAIDPERHHITFDRPTTIAKGGRTCPFHFRRIRNPRGPHDSRP